MSGYLKYWQPYCDQEDYDFYCGSVSWIEIVIPSLVVGLILSMAGFYFEVLV